MSKLLAESLGRSAPQITDKEKKRGEEDLANIEEFINRLLHKYEDDDSLERLDFVSLAAQAAFIWPQAAITQGKKNFAAGIIPSGPSTGSQPALDSPQQGLPAPAPQQQQSAGDTQEIQNLKAENALLKKFIEDEIQARYMFSVPKDASLPQRLGALKRQLEERDNNTVLINELDKNQAVKQWIDQRYIPKGTPAPATPPANSVSKEPLVRIFNALDGLRGREKGGRFGGEVKIVFDANDTATFNSQVTALGKHIGVQSRNPQ